MIRRALHLVRRQREEIRPAVREPGRQIRMVLVRVGTRSHDAADDVGDGGPHACHHHDDVRDDDDGGGGDDDGGVRVWSQAVVRARALDAGTKTQRSPSAPSATERN